MKKKIIEFIKSQIPFEIKSSASFISIILVLILIGFFGKLGSWLFELLIKFISPFAPPFIKAMLGALTYPITVQINLITIFTFLVAFITFFFSTYRFFAKLFLKRGAVVFEDNFVFGNKGWDLNYWGSNDPDKTCRFENSSIIFEAEESDLVDARKEFGAYYDLTTGIYEGSNYEVSCWVKADVNTTMGFKLWVHDTKGHNDIKFPARFNTPGVGFEEVKVGFVGTSSRALRIHLHNKAGTGRIIVNKVRVVRSEG